MIEYYRTDPNNKNKVIVPVPEGIRYISEWSDFNLDWFGKVYIIDKKIPGCGFTEYCLTSDEDIILCSPRKMLLSNKEDQHLGEVHYVRNELDVDIDVDVDLNNIIKKGTSISTTDEVIDIETRNLLIKDKMRNQLINYIHMRDIEHKPCKIIVTYDSFKYVCEFLQEEKMLDGFKVVVDEFQSIFVDSRFKASTEFEFYNKLRTINNKICFVSATPMIDTYLNQLDYFKGLRYFELDWAELDSSRVISPVLKIRKTKSIISEIKRIIQTYLDGNYSVLANPVTGQIVQSKEAVFYLNSVGDIFKIVKSMGLSPDSVNILCADTPQNRVKMKKKLGKKYQIGKVPLRGEPHKMFTFCTRTVYLGADFYSTNARSFILSDANIESLAVDISLDLPQILGRQRLIENPWKNHAEFYFKNLGVGLEVDKKVFDDRIKDKIESTNAFLNVFKKASNKEQDVLINKCSIVIDSTKYRDDYVSVNYYNGTKVPVFNNLVLISEQRAYDIQQIDYKDRFSVFNIVKNNRIKLDRIGKIIDYLRDTSNGQFSERLRYLCETLDFTLEEKSLIAQQVSEKFDKFYNIIGPERCKNLGYNVTDIKKEIENKSISEKDIRNKFLSLFKVGDKFTNIEVKSIIGNIYSELGLNKNPKATVLSEYFDFSRIKLKDDHGEWINGIVIKNIKK